MRCTSLSTFPPAAVGMDGPAVSRWRRLRCQDQQASHGLFALAVCLNGTFSGASLEFADCQEIDGGGGGRDFAPGVGSADLHAVEPTGEEEEGQRDLARKNDVAEFETAAGGRGLVRTEGRCG